jgi:hypothetical protein
MIVITKDHRRSWHRLILDILMESRRGSKRARAWFQGDTWRTVSAEMFNDVQIASIEQQALQLDRTLDRDDEPNKPVTKVKLTDAQRLERKRKRKLASYHKRKAEKLAAAQKAIPTHSGWPSDKGVSHVCT